MADAARKAKTQYYTAATLDGFIADPQQSLDWLFQFGDSATDDYPEFIANVGALAMGAATYEWVLNHLNSAAGQGESWPYEQPTWVFTHRTLPRIEGADLRFAQGNVAEFHSEMLRAAGGKNLWVVGGGDFAGQFHDAGLLDELIVTIASVTLGAGTPLLPRAIVSPPLRLVDTRTFGSAFVQLCYEIDRGS